APRSPNSTTALTKNMPSAAGSVNESAIRPAHATTTPETQKNAVTIAPPRSSPTTTAATTATAPVIRPPTLRNERSQAASERVGAVTGPPAGDAVPGA